MSRHAYVKRIKNYQKRRKAYQKKILALQPLDIPEESFLIRRDEIKIVDNPSDYQLPSGITGYTLRQTHDENLPRYVISYQEALHLADIVALVRCDDPEINVANAIRRYLGVFHRLDELGLSKQDLVQMGKIDLIKYMTVAKKWRESEMLDTIRRERNAKAIEKIQTNIGEDEYTTGYINVIKDSKLHSVYVSDPVVCGKPLDGPLPVLVNVTSLYYPGEEDNGPPSYRFLRCYGCVTFPVLDFNGDRNFYEPFPF